MRFHPTQAALLRCSNKQVAVPAGRGSGKSEIAKRRVVMALPLKRPWPDARYFYALPTLQQAKRVAWEDLKALVPSHWVLDISESDKIITTRYGSELHLLGMDRPMRAEGVQWDGGIIDESSDQKPGVYSKTFVPALTHRDGWCWRIGVPKRFGQGARSFRKFCYSPNVSCFTWPSKDILTESQLLIARNSLDALDFTEQFEASWENTRGVVFTSFSEDSNVTTSAEYDPTKQIIVGSDFNVDPMSWVLAHVSNNGEMLDVFAEISISNTNTSATLNTLFAMYPNHKAGWIFNGDASAASRKTSAESTDYIIILNDQRFTPKRVLYPKSNPSLKARFSACNARLCNANGDIRVRINPRCKKLIDDLLLRAYKPGTSEPSDPPGIGHLSDALGYIIVWRWPLRLQSPPSAILTSG